MSFKIHVAKICFFFRGEICAQIAANITGPPVAGRYLWPQWINTSETGTANWAAAALRAAVAVSQERVLKDEIAVAQSE